MSELALVVVGNGRRDLLDEVVWDADQHLPDLDWLLMVDDTGDPDYAAALDADYPDWTIRHHPQNLGMARAVQAGFDLVLDTSATHVFWLEEDMLLTDRPPVAEAVDILDGRRDLAQIMFRRRPVNPIEKQHGCILAATLTMADRMHLHATWTEHDVIFSLNPSVIPRRVVELGWSHDNEAGMTVKLRSAGYRFGWWGHPHDGQLHVEHLGVRRAARWQL